jgi:hypothetical protein
MSGYKDSMYWASDEEIAAYRERQRKASESASEPVSKPEPAYTPHRSVREGEREYVSVRQCQPVTIDGWDV